MPLYQRQMRFFLFILDILLCRDSQRTLVAGGSPSGALLVPVAHGARQKPVLHRMDVAANDTRRHEEGCVPLDL